MSPSLTPPQQLLLDAVREVAARDSYNDAGDWELPAILGYKPHHAELRGLVELGKLQALPRTSTASGRPYLVWRPRQEDLVPYPNDFEIVRA